MVIVHRGVYQLRVVFLSENFLRKSRFLRTRKMSVSLSGQVLEPSSLELLARLVLVLLVSQQQQQQSPNNVRYPGDLLVAGLEMGAPSVGRSSLVTSWGPVWSWSSSPLSSPPPRTPRRRRSWSSRWATSSRCTTRRRMERPKSADRQN